jgi:UrcA family protein
LDLHKEQFLGTAGAIRRLPCPEDPAMFVKSFLAPLSAAVIVASGANAQALPAHHPAVTSKIVFIGDLNLSSEAGAKAALQRIEVAASNVCGDRPDLRTLDRTDHYQVCVRTAVDHAVASLDSPLMTDLRAPHGVSILASDR